jgi:hypothetical protein
MNSTATAPTRFMPGCDPIVQLARQQRLDELYDQDCRHALDHPSHGLYTGLWIKYEGSRV